MSKIALAALLSCVVMIGSPCAAWTAPNAAPAPSASAPRLASPLPPGRAAGVKQAQRTDWSGPLIGAAVTGGIFLAMLLLIDNDDTAFAYLAIGVVNDLEEAVYFSTVTFSTVGYGDVTPAADWRIFAALEGMNGFILIGWSIAYLIAASTRHGPFRIGEHF
jgi:Ion channel